MVDPSIYISRKAAQRFIDGLEAALRKPDDNPLLHHIYGIGGVGKSTLLQKIRDDFKGDVAFAAASFDVASLIDSPLSLMEHLYLQLQSDEWGDETFIEQYKLYKETLKRLETEPTEGKGSVDLAQVALVKNFVGGIAKVIASFNFSEKVADNVKNVAESAVDVAALALSEKEKWEQLLRKHPATKKRKDLQALMADPLTKLTQAFAAGIIEKSKSKPIVLVLDTYEKASSEFDAFLCKYLVGNAFRQSHSIRIITAGRYSLKKKKYQRIFQSHGENICEYPLDKFDKLETQKYLNQIGIKDADEIRRIFRMTKGLPYYLKVVREQSDRGESVSFSKGRDEIVDRLLHGLTSTEKKVVQLAAHCRWFDRTIIEYLLKEKAVEIEKEPLESKDWFEWLKERDFVIEEDHYRIDDVMRDVIRAALCRDDEQGFRNIHRLLTNYFNQLADEAVSHNSHVSEKYKDSEWRERMIEMTYHSLFASRNEGQHNLLTHFLEGAHFKKPDIARNSFTAIAAEAEFEENQLLPTDTRKFLNSIGSAIAFGWQVIRKSPSHYEFQIRVSKSEEPDNTTDIKEQIEVALRKCFQKNSSISRLAKYVELSGKAVRCAQPSQRKKLLEQATKAIESVVDSEYPDFSSSLFCNIGGGFDSVDAFDEALVSYQAAAEIDPESYVAWLCQGNMLLSLERKREALNTYNVAIELDPDHYVAWNNKGNCLFRMGNYSEALSNLDKAIQLDPDEGSCWSNKGEVLTAMGAL